MTIAVTVPTTFAERMKERIKDSIADLMTDEELSKLIKRATEEVFFTERETKTSTWENNKIKPPLLHEIIQKLLEEQVGLEVSRYMDNHSQEIMEAISEVIKLGAGEAILKALNEKFQMDFNNFAMNLQSNMG